MKPRSPCHTLSGDSKTTELRHRYATLFTLSEGRPEAIPVRVIEIERHLPPPLTLVLLPDRRL
jgi:hypothetical protein